MVLCVSLSMMPLELMRKGNKIYSFILPRIPEKKIIRGGGADGSIIIFNATELLDPGNVGIDDVLDEISPFFFEHADAITPGDLCVVSEATFRFNTRLTLWV